MVTASVLWGIAITVLTEGLSLFSALSFWPLASLWGEICLALIIFNGLMIGRGEMPFKTGWHNLPLVSRLLLVCVGVIVVVCGSIAIISPPNDWDSLTYHMTRVEHWAQNQSVAHYPTHVLRELHRNPWAEFCLLHLRILQGDDRLVNLLQWLSMVGSLAGISLIGRLLGADAHSQVLGVVVAATIPMGILQSSSTQNDYVGAYWAVTLLCFLLACMTEQTAAFHPRRAALIGGCLGLALLTKATSYILVFPFLLWFAFALRRFEIQKSLGVIGLALAIAVMLNLGYYGRNLELFGSLFGPGGSEECATCRLINEAVTPPILISNAVRNVAYHLRTPSQDVNEVVTTFVAEAHRLLGLRINDPRSSWREMTFVLVPPEYNESTDGNPIHVMLILVTLAVLGLRRHAFGAFTRGYAVALTAAFLLLCLVIKWGPPNARYQLGFFILWAPVTGLVLGRIRHEALVSGLGLLLIGLSIPWMVFNNQRPLIAEHNILNTPRIEQFFLSPSDLSYKRSFEGAAAFLDEHKCRDIGIIRGPDDMGYPLWAILRSKPGTAIRVEEVEVRNISKQAHPAAVAKPFDPCAIVSVAGSSITASIKVVSGRTE